MKRIKDTIDRSAKRLRHDDVQGPVGTTPLSSHPSVVGSSSQTNTAPPATPPHDRSTNNAIQGNQDLYSRPLALRLAQTGPDLWSRAADKLSDKDRAWLKASQTPSTGSPVNSLISLINQHRDAYRKQKGNDDTVSSSLTWLHKFREIGDVVSSYDPAHLALPWAGLRFILQCTLACRDTMALAMESVEKTARIVHRCQIYEFLYIEETDFEANLIELYTTLLQFHVRVGRFLSKNTTSRSAWAISKPDEIDNILREIETKETEVGRAVLSCQSRQVSRIDQRSQNLVHKLQRLAELGKQLLRVDQNVLHILRTMEINEMISILEWISPVPYTLHHRRVSELRTAETCEWVKGRPQFREWLSERSSVTLWLQAPAGRGKTFITSKVIDLVRAALESEENHEGFAFFYCSQTEDNRRRALPVLQSYVRQLSAPRYLSSDGQPNGARMHAALKKLHVDSKLSGSDWTMELCKKHLIALLNLYPRTSIILDALDECDASDRPLLLNFFNSLPREVSKPVKVFIASRPESDIRMRLISLPNIEITAYYNTEDIERFVAERMNSQSPWTPVLAHNVSLREAVMQTLVKKSQGMFQYAFLQIGQLADLDNEHDIRERLKGLPTGLTKTYDEIYQRIEKRGSFAKEATLRAIKWVIGTDEPISTNMLFKLVRANVKMEKLDTRDEAQQYDIPGWCANLLTIDATGYQPVWRPCHFSVVEYFENKWGNSDARCFVAKAYMMLMLSIPSQNEYEVDYGLVSFIRLRWEKSVRAEDRPGCSVELSRLVKKFLGAPGQSSEEYQWWCRKFGYQLSPSTISAFGMCQWSFYFLLQDWWESTQNDDWKFEINEEGHCLLTLAASRGSEQICESLIRRGLKVNPENEAEMWGSPLVAAIDEGHVHVMNLLIKKGADVNQVLLHGHYGSSLSAAVFDGLEIVETLLRHGADVNLQLKGGDYGSPLAAAAEYNLRSIVELLLEKGADPNQQLQVGDYGSALAAASYGGDIKIVQLLIEKGANVNQQLQIGEYGSALAAASYGGDIETVQLLIDEGADVNQQLQSGDYGSALVTAAYGLSLEVVKHLVECGADVHQQLQCGRYGGPLVAATEQGNITVMQYLLGLGIDVNQQYHHGQYGTALIAASDWGRVNAVDLLLENEADVNQQSHTGDYGSALAAAAAAASYDSFTFAVTHLITHGAKVNMTLQGGVYGSALIAAAHVHNFQGLEALIDSGADVNLYAETGQFSTALAAVRAKPLTEGAKLDREALDEDEDAIIDLLLHHGATESSADSALSSSDHE